MKITSSLAAFMTFLVFLCGAAQAAALDNRVPQDTVIYVAWQGADALGPQYDKSNLKAILEASTIRNFINAQLPKLMAQASQNDPEAAKMIEKAKTGLGILWRRPTAFYFCPLDFSADPRKPVLRFGIMCDAGDDAKTLVSVLKETLLTLPQNSDVPLNVVESGTMVTLTFGKGAPPENSPTSSLSSSADYTKAMAMLKHNGQPALALYCDIRKLIANISGGLNGDPTVPAEVKAHVPQVIEALGLNGLTQVAYAGGFDNKGWAEQAMIGVTGARKGILTLMDSAPVADSQLALVPKDAATFAASRLEIARIYAEIRNVITQIDPNALRDFDAAIRDGNQQLGLNIEKDIIAALGDEWTFYRAPLEEGGLSLTLIHKLKDGEAFAKVLGTIEKLYNDAAGQNNIPFKVEKITINKTEVSAVMFPPSYSVAWVVRNGYLYVSTLPGIPAAVANVESKGPSIIDSDIYKTTLAALPKGIKPTSISYSQPARLYPEFRQLVLSLLPLARTAGIDIPLDILPDSFAVKEFMTPGAAVTWNDADGTHFAATDAFPGAQLLGAQQISGGVAVAAVGGAILLPSLARAREVGGRTTDMANLRGITQGSIIWSMDNKDAMPDHLGRLIASGMLSPKQLVSQRSGSQVFEMTPELEQLAKTDFAKFAAEVDKHCDYTYIGKGTKNETDAGVIVAYEKPGAWTKDGLNIAFQDGHVEFIRWSNLAEAFAATNESRRKHELPAIDVAAIIKAGPVILP